MSTITKANEVLPDFLQELKEKYSGMEIEEAETLPTMAKIRLAEFPKRYQEASFDNYQLYGTEAQQERQRRLIQHFREQKSVILYGNNGTGKTHLAFASMRESILKGQSCKYVSLLDLIDEIKLSFSSNITIRVIEKYVFYDYLIIDEMDKSYGTQTDFLSIFRIMNGRYNEMRQTTLITNAGKENVIDIIGRSTYERIVEDGTAFHMDWDSFRKPK